MTSIGVDAFYGSRLKSITIPNSVTSIGNRAFGCGLTSAVFVNPNGWRVENDSYGEKKSLTSKELSDPSTAADYFTSKFSHWNWYRS